MSWPTWLPRRATPTTTSSFSLKRFRGSGPLPTGGGRLCVLSTVLALAGCGASSSHAPAPKRGGVLVAALGDSITAGSPAWDPDPTVRSRLRAPPDEHSQYEYWARRANRSLKFRNCGVFGERTDQIADRLDQCARGASVLIVQGGINDIAQGRSVDAAAADLERMVKRGREGGRRVLLAEALTWTNGRPRADAPIRRLNRLIRAIGARERVAVLPWYGALEDPATPGAFRNDLTADGDHPSVRGYRILGRLVAARL